MRQVLVSRRPAGRAGNRPRNPPGTNTVDSRTQTILELQRTAGNRAVTEALQGGHGQLVLQRFGIDDIGEAITTGVEALVDAAKTGVATVVALGKPTLRMGSTKKADIRELQELLVKRGAAIVVDGDFGKKTDAAVKKIQVDHGLVVDGVAGQKTWTALLAGVQSDPDPGRRRKRAFAQASASEKTDWALLGGTPKQWDDGESPGLQAGTSFVKLTDAQKAAAVRLGYTKESWDKGREATADRATQEYKAEEDKAATKSGGSLPAKWAGSLRSRTILDAEFGHIKPIDMPKVVLQTAAENKASYEGIHGAGSYPAGGLEGFEHNGTNFLNMGDQSADTVIHEMLHTQEHSDWDAFAYTTETTIGEGATEMLTKRAATRFEIPTSTSYPSEHALVTKMNTHSSQEQMMKAYFLGGANVTKYRNEVAAGLVAGKTYADFQARIDAADIPGARAMLR